MRNKSKFFTRVEGGLKVPCSFDLYEDELTDYTKVEKKEVFSKMLKMKITSRVVKIEKVYVHALFFEDGKICDVKENGFVLRPNTTEITL